MYPLDSDDQKDLNLHILVVDDDEGILDLIRDVLSSAYVVRTAPDGYRALELLEAEHFDLLIVDLGLPGVSGMDLIRLYRGQEIGRSLPILGLSAYPELRERVAGLGVDGILAKRFMLGELEGEVQDLLDPETGPHPRSGPTLGVAAS